MMSERVLDELDRNGFAFLRNAYSRVELDAIVKAVTTVDQSDPAVMHSSETYAIRQVLSHASSLGSLIWTRRMKEVVREIIGDGGLVVKSIWFDKPPGGNWFVGYHQDISIHVEKRIEAPGFSRWTAKHGLVGVVPPVEVLEKTLTLRIHIDDATAYNGALKVWPATHGQGILRDTNVGEEEVQCLMQAGDVMLMRPLLLHASMRSSVHAPRRVLHLEVTNFELGHGLVWAERHEVDG
jgi:hypothetical protein